ncbi:hypothetical protein [Algoriphagus resistens]|uniref:hypothetical protein n=1 Tax=Algoriphagus resistens TaxID=1750590 RepID=UPI0007168A23|nr:hypothetical protein [Algoriphagus resistens]
MKYDSHDKLDVFTGNVHLRTERLEVINAEKAIYNRESRELIITGIDKLSFKGGLKKIPGADNRIIRYKLGESMAYLDSIR